MADINEILRLNPKAAEELEGSKEILATLRKLREAGLTRGEQFRPNGRPSVADMKPKGIVRGGLKLTFRA